MKAKMQGHQQRVRIVGCRTSKEQLAVALHNIGRRLKRKAHWAARLLSKATRQPQHRAKPIDSIPKKRQSWFRRARLAAERVITK